MKKEDFTTKTCYNIDTFKECKENDDYMYVIGVKNDVITKSDIFYSIEEVYMNSEGDVLDEEDTDMIEKLYSEKYDFYFIFPEEDERQEFINENKLN